MNEPSIRIATHEDLAAIDAIYDHYVATATCTWQYGRRRRRSGAPGSTRTASSIR